MIIAWSARKNRFVRRVRGKKENDREKTAQSTLTKTSFSSHSEIKVSAKERINIEKKLGEASLRKVLKSLWEEGGGTVYDY